MGAGAQYRENISGPPISTHHGMTNSDEILHRDKTGRDENFYRVDHVRPVP